MKKNIVLNKHVNFLINQIEICNEVPNLKRKYSYTLGAIRALFYSQQISRLEYFHFMKLAINTSNKQRRKLNKPFWDNIKLSNLSVEEATRFAPPHESGAPD